MSARAFTVIDVEQRSPEWFAARLGRVTSTAADALLSKGRNGDESAGRRNLRVRLALERVTGRTVEDNSHQTRAMQAGAEAEPAAVALYEAATGLIIQRTGFLSHNALMAGTSLDGHVGDFAGLVEIKSPLPATHLDYLRTGTIPTDYMRQVIHALWLTGAEWCDWMSYSPAFPDELQTKIVRVSRAGVDLAAYDAELRRFLAEVDALAADVLEMAERGAA